MGGGGFAGTLNSQRKVYGAAAFAEPLEACHFCRFLVLDFETRIAATILILIKHVGCFS